MRYFVELYQNTDVELILINNADYHSPFAAQPVEATNWGNANPYKVATIAYDAFVMCQVIKNLATTTNITLHGHSRGGAVILEAAKQQPRLMANIIALLEAPVLPQAHIVGKNEAMMNYGGYYLFPLAFAFLRLLPESTRLLHPLMKIATPVKKRIFADFCFNPKHYRTIIDSIQDISAWHRISTYELYQNFKSITVVVGERDGVLSRRAMMKSAAQAERVEVIQTTGTNHFVSLERPSLMLEFLGKLWSDASVSRPVAVVHT
jgi:pimeloyl-ACP methyl ester carboxylesterase